MAAATATTVSGTISGGAAQQGGAQATLDFFQMDEDSGSMDGVTGDSTPLVPPSTEPTTAAAAAATSQYSPPLWSIDYYRQFFDVDTEQVLNRIKQSMIPFRGTFMVKNKQRGDFYGPFWVSTTLVFVIAMAGNVAEYNAADVEDRATWHYDFSKVSLSATTIYSYVTIVPLIIWAIMRFKTTVPPALRDMFSVYGYSLFLYIPVSFLCIVPHFGSELRLPLLLTTGLLTGAVLVANVSSCLRGQDATLWFAIITCVVAAHAALSVAFGFVFFT